MRKIFSLVLGAILLASATNQVKAKTSVIYDALPSVVPDTSYSSLGFQATQTSEIGDLIHLSGTDRNLTDITLTMVTWAKFADYSTNPTYMNNSSSWIHPITINIYDSTIGTNGVPNHLLGTLTKSVSIPWRPAASEGCSDLRWMDSTGNCNNGYAFNVTFKLDNLKIALPDEIIVGVAYNTNTWGYSPINLAGPFESLNVAVPENQTVSVGYDVSANELFWNTATLSWYTDQTLGANLFRKDANWSPYGTIALRIEAEHKDQKDLCKKDGWKSFSNPKFKNQGACVSHFEREEKSEEKSDKKDEKRDEKREDKKSESKFGQKVERED